jgi:hypothetical protein
MHPESLSKGFNGSSAINALQEERREQASAAPLAAAPAPWEEKLPAKPSLGSSVSQLMGEAGEQETHNAKLATNGSLGQTLATAPDTAPAPTSNVKFVPPTRCSNAPPPWVRTSPVMSQAVPDAAVRLAAAGTAYSDESEEAAAARERASQLPGEALVGRHIFVDGFGPGWVKEFCKVDKKESAMGKHSEHVVDFGSVDAKDERKVLLRRLRGATYNNGYIFRLLDELEYTQRESEAQREEEAKRRSGHMEIIRSTIKDCADRVVHETFALMSRGKGEVQEDDFVDILAAMPELRSYLGITTQDLDVPRSTGGSRYSMAVSLRQMFQQMKKPTGDSVPPGIGGTEFQAYFGPKVVKSGLAGAGAGARTPLPNTPGILPPRPPPALQEHAQSSSSVVSLAMPPAPKPIPEHAVAAGGAPPAAANPKAPEDADVSKTPRAGAASPELLFHENLHIAAQKAMTPKNESFENIGKVGNLKDGALGNVTSNLDVQAAMTPQYTNAPYLRGGSPTKMQMSTSSLRSGSGKPRPKHTLRVNRANASQRRALAATSVQGVYTTNANEAVTLERTASPTDQYDSTWTPGYMRRTSSIETKYTTTKYKTERGKHSSYHERHIIM